jgi:hypothetical protein
MTLPAVIAAKYLHDFVVWVRFNDGAEGELDFRNDLEGPIFEPLKAVEYFRRVQLHPELRTLVWPNGADFAPEYLRDKLAVPV